MSFNLKNYYSPTPKKMRKSGDALLAAVSIFAIGGLFGYDQLKELYEPTQIRKGMTILIVTCVVGKFLTNFFAEETTNKVS